MPKSPSKKLFSFARERKGLTLLEMIVAFGIFSAAMITAVGILIGVSQANQKSEGGQAVIDNLRFSLELITREMRTGIDFTIVKETDRHHLCQVAGSDGIEFIDKNVPAGEGKRRYYYLADRFPTDSPNGTPDTIFRIALNNETPITATTADCTAINIQNAVGGAVPFTSGDTLVEKFKIKLEGSGPDSSDGQPRVTLSLGVKSPRQRLQTDSLMNLQTTVIQRLLEE